MIQIFGKILSNKKRIHGALKTISGLNDYQIKNICNELNIGFDCKVTDLSQFYVIKLLKLIEKQNLFIETSLKKEVQFNLKRLIEVKSYRGLKSLRKRIIIKK